MDARTLRQTPQFLLLITANVLPVYGAFTGKIVFFQVLWLYWLESLLLIGFDVIRILSARGTGAGPDASPDVAHALLLIDDNNFPGVWTRIMLAVRIIVVRALILAFYLLFLIIFVGFQVTDDAHTMAVGRSLAFQDDFVNTAALIFIINASIQLVAGFFLNGYYRRISPRMYADIISPRAIVIHVMIGSSVFIHKFLFEGKAYAWFGESVYVGIFMLIRTVLDIRALRRREGGGGEAEVMI